jgi:hypothetical protein
MEMVTFTPNTETVYLDQPAAGIKNIVSNKIQIVDMILPSGSTLSNKLNSTTISWW